MPHAGAETEAGRGPARGRSGVVASRAERLPEFGDPAFGRLFDRFADARVVLLGEAMCGSSEFCRTRAEVTRWLVEKRGFNILALDVDSLDAAVLDAAVRPHDRSVRAREAFTGFPAWRWRNREFSDLLSWLGAHNRGRIEGERTAVYGLDLYNLAASMRVAVDDLARRDPEAAAVARARFGGLTPWTADPASPGRAVSGRYAANDARVNAMLAERLRRQMSDAADYWEALQGPVRSARLVREAEAYYRALYYGGGEAWNLRERGLFETLQALLAARGPEARAVVWAHNAQVGDARATDMGLIRDQVSLGQLCREAYQDSAVLIGLGAHGGAAACAPEWDGPLQVRPLCPSLVESHERQAHDTGIDRFLLDLRPNNANGPIRRALAEPRPQRFIGPVYRPETERWSHHMECRLPDQFDAYVWFDETTPLTPLPPPKAGQSELWPFGL